MKRLLIVLCLVASTAFAGERILGLIHTYSTSKSNASQAPDGGFQFYDGGLDQPFPIPSVGDKITVVCQYASYVCTDVAACSAATGLPLQAGVILPTSTGGANIVKIDTAKNPDAGTTPTLTDAGDYFQKPIWTSLVSILDQAADGGDHSCQIFERSGRE